MIIGLLLSMRVCEKENVNRRFARYYERDEKIRKKGWIKKFKKSIIFKE